jgi:hypothetical protein
VLYGLAILAVIGELRTLSGRSGSTSREVRWIVTALILFAVGAVVWWYSRTGHALCSANGIWQWHGLWHVLAAMSLMALFMYWRSEV